MRSYSPRPDQIVGTFEHTTINELEKMVAQWATTYFGLRVDQIKFEYEPTEFTCDMTLSGEVVSRRASTRVHASV